MPVRISRSHMCHTCPGVSVISVLEWRSVFGRGTWSSQLLVSTVASWRFLSIARSLLPGEALPEQWHLSGYVEWLSMYLSTGLQWCDMQKCHSTLPLESVLEQCPLREYASWPQLSMHVSTRLRRTSMRTGDQLVFVESLPKSRHLHLTTHVLCLSLSDCVHGRHLSDTDQ